ncbi:MULTISPECIES: HNH endonuclease [Bacillus cereus group]|uniref:HNH endonuclease n=1 Tax=Bacillus cereus group TaxID=86661 RepID=UPI000778861C|nr:MULTISPECIES: HNH endonuclease [Bacillus cereus group]KXY96489.1 hypothetical protein AT280_07625 [Bacillus cereus]
MGRKTDFTEKTKEILAKRVGYRCSNPKCRKGTSRPHPINENKSINVGEAAHIKGASENGPRFDLHLSIPECKSISNGIWLCQQCHKVVDDKELSKTLTVETLLYWKKLAESIASKEAAYSEKIEDKIFVYDKLLSIKKNLEIFKSKWPPIPVTSFEGWSIFSVHAATIKKDKLQQEKEIEFNENLLPDIEKIVELTTLILGDHHQFLEELNKAINNIKEYHDSSYNDFIKVIEKIVTFLDTN